MHAPDKSMTDSGEPRRVRLKSDPTRIGIPTGRSRDRRGLVMVQVAFPDGYQFIPEDNLEQIGTGPADPIDQLGSGTFGRAGDLRRILTHVRLTGRLADVIYSMDTTGTDFYPFQFKPLLKLLRSATNGILIADEVGLGKTIEAGLIWTEFRARYDFRRLLVLCPAMLREKWQFELGRRFGVRADICDATEMLRRLQSSVTDPNYQQFALIGSLQGLRPWRGWSRDEVDERTLPPASRLARFMEEREFDSPLVDLLVVDEAHYLRNPETMTSKLGELCRKVSEFALFLSATPIHLRSRDLFQLVHQLDPDSFPTPETLDRIIQANEPLVKLRDLVQSGKANPEGFLQLLSEARSAPLLRGSQQLLTLAENPPALEDLRNTARINELCERIERINLLSHVVTRTKKREFEEGRVQREPVDEGVRLMGPERDFYETVTDLVRAYSERSGGPEGFLLVTPQRQMSSSIPAAFRHWRVESEAGTTAASDAEVMEDLGIELDSVDREQPLIDSLRRELVGRFDYRQLREADSKYARLRDLICTYFEDHPGEKVVLFSFFRATLGYLQERLQEDGIPCILLKGGMTEKDLVVREFRERDGSAVLLSSEVGSEGIDLQFCRVLINYDLPWNPMRLEQRIGRLDRIGQRAGKITIWNLFYEETIDSRIYERLLKRLQLFERTLGSLEPIIAEQIGRLTRDLLSGELSSKQEEARIDQTAQAVENWAREEERLEEEASTLVAHGDYLLNQVNAARELSRRIQDGDIENYVVDFFTRHYPGCDFHRVGDQELDYRIALSTDAALDFERFANRRSTGFVSHLIRGPASPAFCRFKNKTVSDNQRFELINQFHPIVRFVSHRHRDFKEEPKLALTAAINSLQGPSGLRPGIYVFGVQRWSIGGVRDREKLFYTARSLYGADPKPTPEQAEYLVVAASTVGRDWLGAPSSVDLGKAKELVNEECFYEADEAYETFVEEIKAENQDRAEIQLRSLKANLEREIRTLEDVRDRHSARGRDSLVKATEGKMKKLTERFEMRRRELERNRQVTHRKDEVAVGLVLVEAGTST